MNVNCEEFWRGMIPVFGITGGNSWPGIWRMFIEVGAGSVENMTWSTLCRASTMRASVLAWPV